MEKLRPFPSGRFLRALVAVPLGVLLAGGAACAVKRPPETRQILDEALPETTEVPPVRMP